MVVEAHESGRPGSVRFVGVDPGTAVLGFGVVETQGSRLRALEYGVVRTPAGAAPETRLLTLYDHIRALCARWRPEGVAVEQVYFKRNVTSALAVGQARGVVLLAAAQAALPVLEFPPHAVKQAVTGQGRADKEQVQEMVRLLLGLSEVPRPDDAADALAMAVCGLHQMQSSRSLRGAAAASAAAGAGRPR